ncbi:DEAD/DEAH box helicase [Microbacterium sp. CFBP9034]|uniref:DEAD/DEAH box helicase n=1 Tax=Microbacterium sp. CFBP9034 TaxID=3096540 RepID=UPI002A6AE6A4|nr:DEAD/DEAH box helicase [Microbacterium sp. CFBP9034]MDY0909517.1 helicase C-terminal domain-containing protein [Microbacterium sp. CFBP9034]
MAVDFSRIGASRRPAPIDPRDIFTSLPNKPWTRLRLEQGEVLKEWFAKRTERDTVIKQNTGGGKTVIGLLIGQSSLNEQAGPVAYLAPDTYLAAQVVHEAERLGIAVTQDRRDDRFLSGEAILVTTFQKLVNGRSGFGVIGTGRPIQRIGTVIVDDAHAALSIAERQFTVSVERGHEAYNKLVELFRDALAHQSAAGARAIDDGIPSSPICVPFWEWQSRLSQVRDILGPFAQLDSEPWIFFAWPALSQVLELCTATVTTDTFEIKPYCAPVDLIPAFAQADRRVYLTATLADDSVLVTELGAEPSNVAKPISPERAADLGDRLILAPLALNPSLSEEAVRALVREFANGDYTGSGTPTDPAINAIVLVPSNVRAAKWAPYADETCRVQDLDAVVQRLKGGEHIGVVVLVNKYDGVDLPGDACRLLVVDGVPFPLAPSEAREASALAGTDTFAARQVQKIEQGMGRGIRDAEDHCAVLLMGADLAMTLKNPKYRDLYSPATRAQIGLSQDVAAQLQNQGIDAIREALGLFLRRDPGWLQVSSEAIAGIAYDSDGHVTEIAVARRQAFDLARAGQTLEASSRVAQALASIATPYESGWYREEVARYQHATNPDGAQSTLREARLANINVLLPLSTPPVQRLRATAEQAQAASIFLTGKYATGVELVLGVQMMLGDMAFDPARVPDAEAAFMLLGLHIGFAAERPDKVYGTGPDVLWSVRDDLQLLIELKTGVTRADLRIKKSELDQLSGHVSWHRANYGSQDSSIPVLVHPESIHLTDGTPPPGTRILTPFGVDDLKTRVKAFADAVSVADGWKMPERVQALLSLHGLTGRDALLRSTVAPTSA